MAIVAILSIIGAAAYGSFTSKAQVSEALTQSAGAKLAMEAEYASSGGIPPTNNVAAGLPANPDALGGRYVELVQIAGGKVIAQFRPTADPDLAGTQVTFTPHESSGGAMVWVCGYASPPTEGGVPMSVAGTIAGAPVSSIAVTTTPERLLPSSCRS